MTLDEAIKRYGPIENGAWPNESSWCSTFQVPEDIAVCWVNSNTGKPTNHVFCNKDIQGPLASALSSIRDKGLITELTSFDGCFQIRDVRGEPGKLSAHSYAIAIDINAALNPLGGPSTLSPALIQCFTDAGFKWGGNFKRIDSMHLSLGW